MQKIIVMAGLTIGIAVSAAAQAADPMVAVSMHFGADCSECESFLVHDVLEIEKRLGIELIVDRHILSGVDAYLELLETGLSLGADITTMPVMIVDSQVLQGLREIKEQLPGILASMDAQEGLSYRDVIYHQSKRPAFEIVSARIVPSALLALLAIGIITASNPGRSAWMIALSLAAYIVATGLGVPWELTGRRIFVAAGIGIWMIYTYSRLVRAESSRSDSLSVVLLAGVSILLGYLSSLFPQVPVMPVAPVIGILAVTALSSRNTALEPWLTSATLLAAAALPVLAISLQL